MLRWHSRCSSRSREVAAAPAGHTARSRRRSRRLPALQRPHGPPASCSSSSSRKTI